MPHNFIRIQSTTPNPGPWKHGRLEALCRHHKCTLEHAWAKQGGESAVRYVLVRYGDTPESNIEGLIAELQPEEVVDLHEAAAD